MRRGAHDRGGAALGEPDEGRALEPRGVHDCEGVVGVLLHRPGAVGAIRKALAALVVGHDAGECSEAVEEPLHERLLEARTSRCPTNPPSQSDVDIALAEDRSSAMLVPSALVV